MYIGVKCRETFTVSLLHVLPNDLSDSPNQTGTLLSCGQQHQVPAEKRLFL